MIERKSYGKSLYSITENGINTCTRMTYYPKTDCMSVSTTFGRHVSILKPPTNNRESATFLGCHVAERVLRNVFKDVEMMPWRNPGYDFICNHGKKIDVKSSCISYHSRSKGSWSFKIGRNVIADHFLCIAFDDRESLTPLYLWLIPGHVVNDKGSVGISKSTIDKWKQYRLDIDKVITCCNAMKEGDI